MPLDRDARVMLIASNVSHNVRKWQWLYRWLDENAVRLGAAMMRPHYRKVSTLKGSRVTSLAFLTRLRTLVREKEAEAVDVVLNVHGRPNALKFADGWAQVADLADRVKALGASNRLRLLYSTCCYGANHVPAFVDAGFTVAGGARRVNTNGTYDFPMQLDRWRGGRPYREAVEAGNHTAMLAIHDGLATAFGFSDADSYKVVVGDGAVTIASPA